MRLRAFGWELAFLFPVVGFVLVGILAGSTLIVSVAMIAVVVATPVVMVSFVVRLIAGILDEQRRRRLVRALR
jgi:uncharacterized membrane protein